MVLLKIVLLPAQGIANEAQCGSDAVELEDRPVKDETGPTEEQVSAQRGYLYPRRHALSCTVTLLKTAVAMD
jgi:hypothetical protein